MFVSVGLAQTPRPITPPATDARRLALVRTLHTAIYLVVAAGVFVVLWAGITGRHGPWLWVTLAVVLLESAVFAANGFRCPLTAIAVRYGATKDGGYDTLLPERCTRHTFRVFGPLVVVGLVLLAARAVWWGWG